jgi:hypothetical protein
MPNGLLPQHPCCVSIPPAFVTIPPACSVFSTNSITHITTSLRSLQQHLLPALSLFLIRITPHNNHHSLILIGSLVVSFSPKCNLLEGRLHSGPLWGSAPKTVPDTGVTLQMWFRLQTSLCLGPAQVPFLRSRASKPESFGHNTTRIVFTYTHTHTHTHTHTPESAQAFSIGWAMNISPVR